MTETKGNLASVDSLVAGFESGELHDYHSPALILAEPPRTKFKFLVDGEPDESPDEDIAGVWFDEEELEGYDGLDGFHPRCETFEFSVLWYTIVEDYFDYYQAGDWSVEHGGLRFEYEGGAKDEANLHATVEALWPLAYAKYVEVCDALVARGNVEIYKR